MNKIKSWLTFAAIILCGGAWAATWTGDLAADAVTVSTQAQLSFESLLAAMPDADADAYPMVQGVLGGTYVDGRPAVKGAVVVEKTADSVTIQLQVPQTHLKIVEVKLTAATDGGVQMTRLHRGYVNNSVAGLGTKVTYNNWDSQAVGVYQLKSFTVVLPKQAVTFTAANATDWAGKVLPTVAKTVAATGNISFAGDTTYLQTLDNATGDTIASATVAHVSDVTSGYDVLGLHAIRGGSTGLGAITRDVYLMVSGGSPLVISAGEDAAYNCGTKTIPTGNLLVNVNGAATPTAVFGAGHRGGGEGGVVANVNGNVGVVIDGNAQVSGPILGGWSSVHNRTPLVTGNTSVLVKNVQTTASNVKPVPGNDASIDGYIAGGSGFLGNGGGCTITGNTSVEVAISEGSGTFAKKIYGGSYKTNANGGYSAMTVQGSSSVKITAPNTVSFTDVVGAGHSTGGTTASVGGNASVTINGGTYTGTIYAGGDNGASTPVTGTATLTLQAGDFSGATLKGGQATGAKTLVAVGAVTLTPTQISGFDTIVAREGGALTLNVASDTAMSNIATEGTGYIVKAGAGTLDVGSLRPRMDVQAGKVKLLATGDDIAAGYIILPIPATASEGEAGKVLVVDANGEAITLDGDPVVDTTAGTVRINLQVNTVINTTGNLSSSIQDSSSGLFLIQGPATGDPIVITIDRATPDAVNYQVSGLVKFILADGQSLMSLDKFAFEEGSELILDASCAGTITVPAGKAITIGGGTYTIVNNGTVSVKGDTTVTLTNNDTGVFDVVSGNASVGAPANQTVKGTIYVRSGAVFTNVRTSDAIDYNGTINIHVYGTLAFGATRWTFGANNNLYLYTGATVTGTGDGGNGALDFNGGNGNIFVKPNGSTTGTVTCSAPMRNRQGGTVNVDANMTFETTGNLINYSNGSPIKAGAGTWVVKGGTYSSGATVNGGTLKLVGITPGNTITMGDGTLELAQNANDEAFTFTGTVASSSLGKGAIKTAGSTVTLSGTFTNYSGDINSSAANSKFIIPDGQEVTVGWIVSGSAIEIEGVLVHTNKATNAYTNYQGQNLRNLTGHGTFKITGPHYFFTCGTSNLDNYWASTLAVWNDRGDSTIADNKGMIFGQPNNANATITIGTLSGAGLIRSDANSGDRSIKVLQAKDSEWSGAFNAGDRVKAFIVAGADDATAKTLTLSGTQTHTNDLTIEGTGSAKLTGTWIADTTTVNGRLEVMNTATLTSTTLTYSGKMTTENSVIYYGCDEAAAMDAEVKVTGGDKDVYYATVAEAVTAGGTLATMTLVKTPTSTLPTGYALVTPTGAGVVSLRQAGEIYWKDGDWQANTTYYATSDKNSTTTYLTGDVVVFNTDTTVYYMQSWSEVVSAKIAENTTVIFGHNDWNGDTTRNIMSGSTITVAEGGRALFGFWDNKNDRGHPIIRDLTINGAGTWGQANNLKDGVRANPKDLEISGAVTGTAKLIINDGDNVKVLSTGSVANGIVSGVNGKSVKVTTDAQSTKAYSLIDTSTDPIEPSDDPAAPAVVIEDVGTGITMAPGAKVKVVLPADATDAQKAEIAAKIAVKYGDWVLKGSLGTNYVDATIDADGTVVLTTTDNAIPPASEIAMALPTVDTQDKVAFTIETPVPGLFYSISSASDPSEFTKQSGAVTTSEGVQATADEMLDGKTISIPQPTTAKVMYFKVSVKATK